MIIKATALAVLSLVPWPLFAQDAEPSFPNTIEITAEELRTGLYGYDLFDVLAALRMKAGLTVKSSSDIGAEDWLLIRGYPRDSARNVLVFIDGMPLNDALSGSNEFEHLPPIELIEKIIIHKPPLPARFGGAQAAIEIMTKEHTDGFHSEIAGAYGERKSGFASALSEGSLGNFSYFAMVDYLRTDNLTGVRRTPPRENIVYGDRSYWIVKPVAKLKYEFSERSHLSLFSQYIKSEKFYSDDLFRGQREFRNRSLTNFNLTYAWKPGENSSFAASAFRTDEDYELNLRLHPTVRDQKRVVQGIKIDTSAALPFHQILSAGGFFADMQAEERLGTPLTLDHVSTLGLYIEDQINPLRNLWLTLGLRYDDHSEADGEIRPSFAAVYRPIPKIAFHGIWGRSVRWPGLSEFDQKSPGLDLRGEEMEGFEIGTSYDLAAWKASAKISYFQLKLKGESKFFMDMSQIPPSFYYLNVSDEVESKGVEFEMNVAPSSQWSGFLNYTYNPVKRMPGEASVDFSGPENLLNAGIVFTGNSSQGQLTLRYGGQATGVQAEGGLPVELDDWLVLDVAGAMRLMNRVNLFIRVSNIFDKSYETFDGRPMFGRIATAGLDIHF